MPPSISVNGESVEFLHSPEEYYKRVLTLVTKATTRVTLAALYIGEGPKQDRLRAAIEAKAKSGVPVHVLLDNKRSTRKGCPVLSQDGDRLSVELFHHPLHSLWEDLLPERVIEAIGTQHIKAVVSDDTVLITGANFSTSYFTNRQDRYMVVKSRALADMVHTIVTNPHETTMNSSPDVAVTVGDTKITVAVQAGYRAVYGVDSLVKRILHRAAQWKRPVIVASGYLNLPTDVQRDLAACESVELIAAAPMANSFYKSQGVSKFIPDMYSYFEEKLLKKYPHWPIFEYAKPAWTFHAKGLWVMDEIGLPEATVIGSSNFSLRSRTRDLEMCFLVETENHKLKMQMKQEVDRIKAHSQRVDLDTVKHRSALWLKAATGAIFKHFL